MSDGIVCCYCGVDMGEADHEVCDECGNALCDGCMLAMKDDDGRLRGYLCPSCEDDLVHDVAALARIHAKVEARRAADKESAGSKDRTQ